MSISRESSVNFDVEAQQTLLVSPARASEGVYDREFSRVPEPGNQARQTWVRVFLVIRSTVLFKLGADHHYSSSSTTPPRYSPISSPDQDSGAIAAVEILEGPVQNIILGAADSPAPHGHIELQRSQKESITEIVKKRNLQELLNFGGVDGVAEALNTNLETGLSILAEEITHDDNGCKPSLMISLVLTNITNLYKSFLGACNDYTILLLFIAGILSLVFGIKEDGMHNRGWFNGVVVFSTILVLLIRKTIRNFLSARNRTKLENSWQSSQGRRRMKARVVRGGFDLLIDAIDLLAGDIVFLQKGDHVPSDGLFVGGQPLQIDEGLIKSTTFVNQENPFLFYGSRVINGDARMIVTSVGTDTIWGEMMSQASFDKKCALESCLHKLNSCIHFMGILISILIIIVSFIRSKSGHFDDEYGFKPDLKEEPTRVKTIVCAIEGIVTGSGGTRRVLTALFSVSLVGLMEGVPIVISLGILIWNRATLGDMASERDYLACIKMASVTTICTDTFEELREHKMEIDKFYVGEGFVSESTAVDSKVLEFLCDGISIGTLSLKTSDFDESKVVPLVSWAEAKLGMKEECKITTRFGGAWNPFEECCRVMVEKKIGDEGQEKKYYQYCVGLPQGVLNCCSHYYDIEGNRKEINDEKKRMFEKTIGCMLADQGAKVIAYACGSSTTYGSDHDEPLAEAMPLTFLGMISLKDTRKEDIKKAVKALMGGGVRIILCSGDDITLLQDIGQKCGLLTRGSDDNHDLLVLAADEFKTLTDEERMEKVDKICIMGNCLPSDKILLIKCLQEKGQVVALLGQRTLDAPALKQADIGITVGTWSSEIAIESCDISIWDVSIFAFLVNIIEKGRCFHENVRKFMQLQLIVTISSLSINFIGVFFLGDAPMTPVKLFWLNLVVALVGGLAILTGPSAKTLMATAIKSYDEKLITKPMWRNIAIQASYQTTIFVTLHHKGQAVLGISGGLVKTMIYNGFFLCQLFNKFIAREPQRRNIFRGLFGNKNFWFRVALVLFVVCQAIFAIAENVVGSSSSPGLNWKIWGTCLLIAVMCWVLDWIGKNISIFIIAVLSTGFSLELQLDNIILL